MMIMDDLAFALVYFSTFCSLAISVRNIYMYMIIGNIYGFQPDTLRSKNVNLERYSTICNHFSHTCHDCKHQWLCFVYQST